MKKNLISILLTTYNNPKMLREAIESVLAQTCQDFELIILDDNSLPPTDKLIYKYLKHPKIVFYKSNISEEDRWEVSAYARQVNVGLKLANGEFITYLCDDDLYMPRRLEKMMEFLKEHATAKVCYGRQRWINLANKHEGIRQPDTVLSDPAFKVDHSSVMHYRSCIDIVGDWPTDDPRCSDAWFWKKLGVAFSFYPIKEILDIHRYHSNSISSKWDGHVAEPAV